MHEASTMKYSETKKVPQANAIHLPLDNYRMYFSKYTGEQILNLFSRIEAADRGASPFFIKTALLNREAEVCNSSPK